MPGELVETATRSTSVGRVDQFPLAVEPTGGLEPSEQGIERSGADAERSGDVGSRPPFPRLFQEELDDFECGCRKTDVGFHDCSRRSECYRSVRGRSVGLSKVYIAYVDFRPAAVNAFTGASGRSDTQGRDRDLGASVRNCALTSSTIDGEVAGGAQQAHRRIVPRENTPAGHPALPRMLP